VQAAICSFVQCKRSTFVQCKALQGDSVAMMDITCHAPLPINQVVGLAKHSSTADSSLLQVSRSSRGSLLPSHNLVLLLLPPPVTETGAAAAAESGVLQAPKRGESEEEALKLAEGGAIACPLERPGMSWGEGAG